ncbi:MAG: hypothetical protein J6A21_12785 [Lentisphaeria bacterium]|nr:hypothetical protein [Lentisphaeria bacterium]
MRKSRIKTERLLEQAGELLPSFAMHFLHDGEKAAALAEECFLAYAEKLRNGEAEEGGLVFLFREIRKKCFEFLRSQGRRFESFLSVSQERLKAALAEVGPDEGKLYEDLLALAQDFPRLEEQEREELFLILGASLTQEETAAVLDRPAKEVEESTLAALGKLGGGDLTDPGKTVRLNSSIAFLLSRCSERASLSPFQREKILSFASSGTSLGYRKMLYRFAAILLFCIVVTFFMIYSHMRVEPELQPDVQIGVFMSEEERKENLLREKARQEAYLEKKREAAFVAVSLPKKLFPGKGKVDAAAAERTLRRLGAEVKVRKVEVRAEKTDRIFLFVTPEDARKLGKLGKRIKTDEEGSSSGKNIGRKEK